MTTGTTMTGTTGTTGTTDMKSTTDITSTTHLTNTTPEGNTSGPRPLAQAGIGVFLLLMAVAVWLDAGRLPAANVVGIGPAAVLRLVAGVLAALALAHLIAAWRRRAHQGPPADHGNLAALAWVMGALLGLMLVMEFGGGFIVAAAWVFVATARGFGERFSVKSVGIGVVLSALVYLFFTRALSLSLPAGPIEQLLR